MVAGWLGPLVVRTAFLGGGSFDNNGGGGAGWRWGGREGKKRRRAQIPHPPIWVPRFT